MESPEYLIDGICKAGKSQFMPEKRLSDIKSGDCFHIEDLLDFSNEELDGNVDNIAGNSTDSSTITAVETAGSCNSSLSGDGLSCRNYNDIKFSGELAGRNYGNQHYPGELSGQSCRNYSDLHDPGDLCVPYDDLAELEWLSKFVEDSFSSEDVDKLQLFSGIKARENQPENEKLSGRNEFSVNPHSSMGFLPELSIRSKARSKRSRTASCNWSSQILVLSPATSSSESDVLSDSGKSLAKTAKKRETPDSGENRKCLHCATDKTPQWRTGPMGPKTLCNACGVRYKSGRLVPEYRPAASPTFVLTKHSNSHRKVLELRRKKEIQRTHQQYLQQASFFDVAGDDFLIHTVPDFGQLI